MPATPASRNRRQALRLGAFLFLATGAFCSSVVSESHAAGRFGDSTWVAPGVPDEADATGDGPRVAPPDKERTWEAMLRAPFRIVFSPLRFLAMGFEGTAGMFGPALLEPSSVGPPKSGPYPKLYFTQGSGLNDTGIGAKIQWHGFPIEDSRTWFGGTYSPTDRRRLRFRSFIRQTQFVNFAIRGDFDRKPNRPFFGIGNNTPESAESYYLLARSDAEVALRLGRANLRQLRFLVGVSSMSPSRAYNHDGLRLEDVFTTAESAPFARKTTQEFLYGVTGDYAMVDDDRDPSRGVHGRFEVRQALGVRSVDPDFFQWRLEGRGYIPVFATYRVIAFRGVFMGIEPTGDTSVLPYYRLPTSEVANRFAGFTSARFRDRQLMLGRVEYRWQFFRRVMAIAHTEWGQVAPRTESFALRDVHTSYGGGMRIGLADDHAIRFELSTSEEGPAMRLALGGDW